MSHEAESARCEVLLDALPFIQGFRGQIFVIKYGGSAMEDEHLVERTLKDIVFMQAVGIRPVIVHGGGKAITSRMREAGLRAQFIDGLRVTDAASMAIVEHTLHEVINPMIAMTIERFGGKSIGISGKEVIRARKVYAARSRRKGDTVDLGLVGEVSGIVLGPIQSAIERGMIPVVSPIGVDDSGTALNINADVAAGAVAGELHAAKLIFVSDVLGIMRDPSEPDSLIPSVNRDLIARLIKDGVIEGGMIPKVDSAVAALERGVAKAHLIDGRLAHSLLREIFTNSGIGTEIVA